MTGRPKRHLPDRALPERAFIPGETPRPPEPEGEPIDRPADEWRLDEDYLWGVDLYNAGYHWEAHEAWEGIWRAASDRDRRDFLQGLIQCAAAALKSIAGAPNGVRRLAARGTALLEATAAGRGSPFMGLDLDAFVPSFRAWAGGEPPAPRGRPAIHLWTRSRDLPACLTDRRVQPLSAEFRPGPGYLIGRATDRDDYYDGQVLILDRAAAPGEVEARLSDCRREMGQRPIHRLNLLWEEEGEAPWPHGGAITGVDRYDHLVVLRCERRPEAAPAPAGVELRPLARDSEWEQVVKLSILLHGEQFGSGFAEFARWRYREFRRTFETASSHFWGAFRGGRLVGSLGLYETPTLLRFQEVQTHPNHRRQGVCRALVTRALESAFGRHPRAVAFIVAEPGTPAERIYQRVGFRRAGSQHWLARPRRTARALLEAYVSARNEGAARGELAGAVALFREDAALRVSGPGPSRVQGREAIAEALSHEAPRGALELVEILGETDHAITGACRQRGRPDRRETLTLEARGSQIASLDVALEAPPG